MFDNTMQRVAATSWRRLLQAAFVIIVFSLLSADAGAQATVPVRVIAFNDFHGHLAPDDKSIAVEDPADPSRKVILRSGGAAYLATRIRQLRAEEPHSIVLSSGDLIGASPLASGLFLDEPTIEVMNSIGVEINAIGNHEFDRGLGELQRMISGGCASAPALGRVSCASSDGAFRGARFAFIAANVDYRDGRRPFQSSVVREFDGVKVAFVGAVTRSTPGIVRAGAVTELAFRPEARAINAEAEALHAQGVKAIVAVIHEGGDADGGANGCANPRGSIFDIVRDLDPSIRVVLSAHTHRAYRCLIDGRLVIQAASFGRLVSVVDIELDRISGEIVPGRTRARNVPVPNGLGRQQSAASAAYPPLVPDPAVAALVAHYSARAAPLADRPAGRLAAEFDRHASRGGDHALGRLVADAQLAATRAQGATIALTNPGGIRTDLRPRGTDGTVSYSDVYAAQPFGNTLVTLTLTGAQLKALLEQQWNEHDPNRPRILQPSRGFTYAWDATRPAGDRVIVDSMRLEGRAIDRAATYRVTVNDFLAGGGDGFRVLREGVDAVGGPLDVDALTDYMRTESQTAPLQPDRSSRIGRRNRAPGRLPTPVR